MSRISVRGFAVASATAVTTVGAAVGVAQGSEQSVEPIEATAADATLLADIPAGPQAQVQTASLAQQADTASNAAQAAAQKSAEEAARKQAAKDAEAKKEARERAAAEAAAKAEAERRAAEERERQEELASRSSSRDSFAVQGSYSIADVQSMAMQIVGGGQFQCFSNIVDHESGWDYRASNPSTGAYGLVQALPGSKMSSAGADWQTNPATQIKWGLNYMNERYGSPCGAWDFWQANNWY